MKGLVKMKCNRFLIYGWKTKKAMETSKPPKILVSAPAPVKKDWIISHGEFCGGNIKSNVGIKYIGSYEGEAMFEDAGIEIEFICEKCKNSGGYALPRTVPELTEFLDNIIKEM